MEINLSGKTALVTGGNTGIGKGIALALAHCNVDVAVTYFSNPSEEAVSAIKGMGRKAEAFKMDATNSAEVNQVVTRAAEFLGGHIDILVNNAGHLVARVPVAEMSDEHWHQVVNVNLSSTFYVTRAVLPHMDRGWGRIVNVASLAARNGGGPGAVAYGASKAGVLGYTYGLAKELGGKGITVNAVAPGLILDTPFHATFSPEAAQQAGIAASPLKKAGYPQDVAGAVVYLVSDLASFITGQVMDINGGTWFA